MANPYEEKNKSNDNKSTVSNIGGATSSPTPVTDAMNMDSLRKPLQTFDNTNQPVKMYGGGMVKKYARGGGTRPVRR
jgi:hypothetical protein|tara:strand:+ start:90 stop:320 length:231 start_codon:yes stop_codon:yes gene_type:complete